MELNIYTSNSHDDPAMNTHLLYVNLVVLGDLAVLRNLLVQVATQIGFKFISNICRSLSKCAAAKCEFLLSAWKNLTWCCSGWKGGIWSLS